MDPGITDGAAAVVVTSAARSPSKSAFALWRCITAYAQAAVEPLKLFTAPIFAMRALACKGRPPPSPIMISWRSTRPLPAQVLADGRALEG